MNIRTLAPPDALEAARDAAFCRYGEITRFGFDDTDGGQLVASVDRRCPDAGLGFVDVAALPADPGAASALVDAGMEWLRARGCDRAQANIARHTWYGFRVVVEGFGRFPRFSGEPWNTPELAEQLVGHGFEAVAWYQSSWGGDSRRFLAAGEPKIRAMQERGYSVRPFDPAHAGRDLALVHQITCEAFRAPENYLFHPIDFEEFQLVLGPGGEGLEPAFLQLVTAPDGTPAAFVYATVEGEDVVSIKTLAVVPSHRSAGLGGALGARIHQEAAARGRHRIIHALMRTGNHSTDIDRTADYETLRRYVVMERRL